MADPPSWPPGPVPGFPGAPRPNVGQYGLPGWRPLPAYQDAKQLTLAIVILLGCFLVVTLISTLTSETTVTSNANGVQAQYQQGPIGVLGLALFVALAIMTPMWLARIHRNAEAISGQPLPKSSGWTAGAWFIPIVGGFLAAKPLVRIWERAPGGSKAKPLAWALLWSIWQCVVVLYVILLVTAMAAEVSKRGDPATFTDRDWDEVGQAVADRYPGVGYVLAAFHIAAGIGMGATVLAIHNAQRQKAQGLGVLGSMTLTP